MADPSFQLIHPLSGGWRFLRDARALVSDDQDALRIETDGRVVPFPEIGDHQAHFDEEEIPGFDRGYLIAFVGRWPDRAFGAQMRHYDNGQTVYLAELVQWDRDHWKYDRLVEPFVGLGEWSNGCVIAPALSDLGLVFGEPDPKHKPSIVALGCTKPKDLPRLPPGTDWADAFSSNRERNAVMLEARNHDDEVVVHLWTPESRDAKRDVFPGLTVDGLYRHQLEPWLVDERNPIVWRTSREPVLFLRRRNLAEPLELGMPTPMLGSVLLHHDGASWRTLPVPDVTFERFASGEDGTIWMAGGGRLWRMNVPGTYESVRLPPSGATRYPSVPIDVMPMDASTVLVIARYGGLGSDRVGLFRYAVPPSMGVAPEQSWPLPGEPDDIFESFATVGGLSLNDFARVVVALEMFPAERPPILEEAGVPNVPVWKEIVRRWRARMAAEPDVAEGYRRSVASHRGYAADRKRAGEAR